MFVNSLLFVSSERKHFLYQQSKNAVNDVQAPSKQLHYFSHYLHAAATGVALSDVEITNAVIGQNMTLTAKAIYNQELNSNPQLVVSMKKTSGASIPCVQNAIGSW